MTNNNNTTNTTTTIGITNTTNANNTWNNSTKGKQRTNGTDPLSKDQFDSLDEWKNNHENDDDQEDDEDDSYFTYYNLSDNSTKIKNLNKKDSSVGNNTMEDCQDLNVTETNQNNSTKRNETNEGIWNYKDNTTATSNSSIITQPANETGKFSSFQLKASFEQWKSIHKKIYASPFEETFRRAIYFDNYQLIALHNADQSNTYNLSLNAFADLQEEEFLHKYLTPKTFQQQIHDKHSQDEYDAAFQNEDDTIFDIILPQSTSYLLANSSGFYNNYTTDNITSQKFTVISPDLPDEFNWKDKGAVTPVKNQGACGSSWAFSAAGLIEGVHFLRTEELASFSEQQLLDCCGKKGHNCEGCQGAWPEQAISYIKHYGILKQSQYPYIGLEGVCAVDVPTEGAFIQSQKYVESNTRSLKQAVVTQPVSVAVDAQKWHLYSSGVFNNCKSLKSAANHAALLVGYTSEGNWIVKNSWGTNWGQSGYITLQSGNTCGIQNFALIAKI